MPQGETTQVDGIREGVRKEYQLGGPERRKGLQKSDGEAREEEGPDAVECLRLVVHR